MALFDWTPAMQLERATGLDGFTSAFANFMAGPGGGDIAKFLTGSGTQGSGTADFFNLLGGLFGGKGMASSSPGGSGSPFDFTKLFSSGGGGGGADGLTGLLESMGEGPSSFGSSSGGTSANPFQLMLAQLGAGGQFLNSGSGTEVGAATGVGTQFLNRIMSGDNDTAKNILGGFGANMLSKGGTQAQIAGGFNMGDLGSGIDSIMNLFGGGKEAKPVTWNNWDPTMLAMMQAAAGQVAPDLAGSTKQYNKETAIADAAGVVDSIFKQFQQQMPQIFNQQTARGAFNSTATQGLADQAMGEAVNKSAQAVLQNIKDYSAIRQGDVSVLAQMLGQGKGSISGSVPGQSGSSSTTGSDIANLVKIAGMFL